MLQCTFNKQYLHVRFILDFIYQDIFYFLKNGISRLFKCYSCEVFTLKESNMLFLKGSFEHNIFDFSRKNSKLHGCSACKMKTESV